MAKKTFISVKRGLTQDPKHRERMGNRVWLFLHIIDRADFETGTAYDWKDKQEAEDMGLNWRTLQRQRQELEELGYIRCELTGRGMSIVVYNWHNPRSYSGEAINKRDFEQGAVSEYADLGTQSTHENTHESTQAPNTELRTPSIRLTGNKSQSTNEEEERAKRQNFIRCYHDNLGFPSPLVIAELERLAVTYTFDQFQTAMSKTLAQGKNSLAYLEGVLKGVGDKPLGARQQGRPSTYQAPRVAANGGQQLAQGFKDY